MNQKPLNALNDALNNRVIVELKGKREFRGVLDGYDLHMNLVLKEAQEIVNGQAVREIPLTILRGDNVIYISP
jgi:small nuclear ribonucleoprotein